MRYDQYVQRFGMNAEKNSNKDVEDCIFCIEIFGVFLPFFLGGALGIGIFLLISSYGFFNYFTGEKLKMLLMVTVLISIFFLCKHLVSVLLFQKKLFENVFILHRKMEDGDSKAIEHVHWYIKTKKLSFTSDLLKHYLS